MKSLDSPSWDIIGVGLGPANLSLAVVIQEDLDRAKSKKKSTLFLESKQSMQWHPDMLIPGATTQVSFLKDLAMLRNPCSRFTFLNYLHTKGRLSEFINMGTFSPTRTELNDYFGWVAEEINLPIQYAKQVINVLPIATQDGNSIDKLEVLVRDGATKKIESHLTQNIVLSTGGAIKMPTGADVSLGKGIFHSSKFLNQIRQNYPDLNAPYRFIVVGSGQSGAEIFHYLATHYPNATVKSTLRSFAYRPMDESSFINEIFFPEKVDLFYNLPDRKRQGLLSRYRDTNYSVVDASLIDEIYKMMYHQRLLGESRLEILPFMALEHGEEINQEVCARFVHLLEDKITEIKCDGMILATGYEHKMQHPLLNSVANYLVSNDDGGYCVSRDYELATTADFAPRIFLQGACEQTHGLTDTLLSILSIRADRIWGALKSSSPQKKSRSQSINGGKDSQDKTTISPV